MRKRRRRRRKEEKLKNDLIVEDYEDNDGLSNKDN